MRLFRSLVAAAVLGGFGAGCSGATASKPANAPPPSEEKPLGTPGMPKGNGPGPKMRKPG